MFLKDYFQGIWKDRYVLQSLVKKDLEMKYRGSALGVAWSVITPLGLVLIIGGVYSIIFGTDPRTFIPLLFAGLNPWLFISSSADGGTMAFITAEGYLKQTTVHAQIFPLRGVMVGFINLLYSILAFFAVYIFLAPHLFGVKMLMLIPGLLIGFCFCTALANISSVINLNIRDYQPLQSLILQGLFYATPVIFDAKMLYDKGFAFVYRINPFYYILEVIRRPMLGERIPSLGVYGVAIGVTILLLLFSIRLVMKAGHGIALKL